tara:strand:- start:65 stop:784 length:720 start_codon:yes stop_codon:yes gene_type:complete
MCTVTFVKSKDGNAILTSNRDEKSHRATLAPSTYSINERNVTFPKDEVADGTWIALGDNGVFCCLLNGGFKIHQSTGNYRRSRGQILLDVFREKSPEEFLNNVDLDNIEPFTLIIYNSIEDKLNVLVWDEKNKHISQLNADEPHFWASATLYSPEFSQKRKQQFFDFMNNQSTNLETVIFTLHNSEKQQNGFILNDRDGIKTVSVTQLILSVLKGKMVYYDLVNETEKIVERKWNKVLL